jgi:N6-adenosine-specific RNA methylase IME4
MDNSLSITGAESSGVSAITVDPQFQKLIPPLAPEELAQLEENILIDGCRDPLVIWNNIIVDGHNRFEICERNAIPFKTVEKEFKGRQDAVEWIILNQFGRRNLPTYERAKLALRLKVVIKDRSQQGKRSDLCQNSDKSEPLDTKRELAKIAGVSHDTIAKVEKIEAKASPEVKAQLASGEISINQAHGQLVREEKRAEATASAALPSAKHRVIYADPPWSYNDKCDAGSVQSGGCEKHYPSMTIAEICAMPVPDICERDSVLFLWVTSPLLFESAKVIEAWGFKYKAQFVWDKMKHNMGHYNSVRHEILLICTRGSCTPENVKLFDSVQSIERKEHSRKPEEFRNIINTLYPSGKKIELFRRGETPDGWAAWGNEVCAKEAGL